MKRIIPQFPSFTLALTLALTLILSSSQTLAYSNLTQEQATARAQQLAGVQYKLSIVLSKGSNTFTGSNTIDFTLLHGQADVVIDFAGKQVNSLMVNGDKNSDFTFDRQNGSIIVPKRSVKPGHNTLVIAFTTEFSHNGTGFHQFIDPLDGHEYLYSDFEPANAHRVFPAFDQPDLKAVFTLDVVAPATWQVIGNRDINKSVASDAVNGAKGAEPRKHHWFNPTQKISTYIFHLSAGAYASWADNSGKYPMRIFARQSLANYMDPQRIFDTTKKGMDFFEQYYDYDYPFTKYDQLFVPEFNAGAMENAGAVTIGEHLLFRTSPTQDALIEQDITILHELAHMWFGNLVTMRWWNDLWLNESFASIMAYVGLEGIGQSAWDKMAAYKGWAYHEDQLVTTHPILTGVADIESASAIFDGITYGKGLSVLRQLQYLIGAEKFRGGIRQYLQQHAFKNTTLVDFIDALETVHGEKLGAWVDSWLRTADINTMTLNYSLREGKIAAAFVIQKPGRHNSTLREHANLLGLYDVQDGELKLREQVKVFFAGPKTPLRMLNGKKAPAVILPNVGGYDYIKTGLDERSFNWLKSHMAQVKDPAIKSMVWEILWHMVRDQQMAASEYLALVFKQLPGEGNVDILTRLLTNTGKVMRYYLTDSTQRQHYRQRLFVLAKEKLDQLEGGSDLQRQWYGELNDAATTPADYRYLTDLYDGKKPIKGIEINRYRQWQILLALARADQKAMVGSRMQALMVADKSARGHNQMLTIKASYPDASVKQRTWEKLTQNNSLSAQEKNAIIAGLYHVDYPALALPYIDKYFAAIEALYQNGAGFGYVEGFIRNAYPDLGLEQTLAATEQFLKTSKISATYKRQIRKELDELKRTLKVRQKNTPGS